MRFILLGINVALMLLLALYLTNLFNVRDYSTETFVFLFVISILSLFFANELQETYKISSLTFIVAVLFTLIISLFIGKNSIVIWLMLSPPAIVATTRYLLGKKG